MLEVTKYCWVVIEVTNPDNPQIINAIHKNINGELIYRPWKGARVYNTKEIVESIVKQLNEKLNPKRRFRYSSAKILSHN